MAKMEPEKFDFDTKMLDVFTDAADRLINAYKEGNVTAENCIAGIGDLVTMTKKIPRSVTIAVGDEDA